MSIVFKVQFRGMDSSPAVASWVEAQVEALLERYRSVRVLHGHATIELLNHRSGKVGNYRALIELTLPGKKLVTEHEPGRRYEHLDAYQAISDALDAMDRCLRDHSQLERGEFHYREAKELSMPTPTPVRLSPDEQEILEGAY